MDRLSHGGLSEQTWRQNRANERNVLPVYYLVPKRSPRVGIFLASEGKGSLREHLKRWAPRAIAPLDIRNNLPILPAMLYSTGLFAYYLLYGVSLDYLPAVIFLGTVCLMSALSIARKANRYLVSLVSIVLSYEALQGVAGTLVTVRGAESLYSFDVLLWGFNVTGWVQSVFVSPVVTFLSSVLYSLEFPLVVATCLVLWYLKKPLLGKYVTVMVLTSYAALLTFILMPTSPPWYSGAAVNLYQVSVASSLPKNLATFISLVEVDQFAAFPSLHAAYAIIFSYFMVKVDRRFALISIPITVGILFSTLYLGQHYVIDLFGGAAYALVPCLIAERFEFRLPGAPSDAKLK